MLETLNWNFVKCTRRGVKNKDYFILVIMKFVKASLQVTIGSWTMRRRTWGQGCIDATLLGEPMHVGGEKGQVWWKLLVACVVYFGDT